MSTAIFPMTYIPKKNIKIKIFSLGFPQEWKKVLIELTQQTRPNFNFDYALPKNYLKDYLNSWMENIVDIKPLRAESDDSAWLISMDPPDLEKICEILKLWVAVTYMNEYVSDETKALAKALIAKMTAKDWRPEIRQTETVLFSDDGCAANDYTYRAFSLLAMSRLIGQKIYLSGTEMTICRTDKDELMTVPIYAQGEKKIDPYAFVIKLSVQTTPPQRKAMLVCDLSIRRFIPRVRKADLWLKNRVIAHVRVAENHFKKIAIQYSRSKKTIVWNQTDEKCYNLYEFTPLPKVRDVLCNVETYFSPNARPQIFCPFANGLIWAEKSQIGTGVSVKDKAEFYDQLYEMLSDYVFIPEVPIKRGAIHAHFEKDAQSRRKRLSDCMESKILNFEVYCHDKDKSLAQDIISEIWAHFGDNEAYKSIVDIRTQMIALGEIGNAMAGDQYSHVLDKIEQIKLRIPPAKERTAAVIVLPGKDDFKKKGSEKDSQNPAGGDPKNAIRAGFADTGRITQFITPEQKEEVIAHKVKAATLDVFRQLGYTEPIKEKNLLDRWPASVMGLHVFTQLEPLYGRSRKDRARYLPIYVTFEPVSGKIYVDCDALEKRHIPYHEAGIQLSKLSRSPDFVKKCTDAFLGTVKQRLLGYRNLYRNTPALLIIQADGNTRSEMWPGISDKSISGYSYLEPYVPEKINIGAKGRAYLQAFTDSQLRIMRVRINQNNSEIPDYYTETKIDGKRGTIHKSASGIYQYQNVFWGLSAKPNDPCYTLSFQHSKIDHPFEEYDERNLVEFFPLQLQSGDDPLKWAQFSNMLRECMPQYAGSATKLPAPLHLATLLKEYLLIK